MYTRLIFFFFFLVVLNICPDLAMRNFAIECFTQISFRTIKFSYGDCDWGISFTLNK